MEGKRGTEAALSLFLCDEIESVVTGTELKQAGSNEEQRPSTESRFTFLMRIKRTIKRRCSFKL